MRRPRPSRAAREQHESEFARILAAFVGRVPGATGAALVDPDGETVDYAGDLDPFSVRVAAAHLRVVFDDARGRPSLEGARWLALRASRGSFLIHEMDEGYALVVLFARASGLVGWRRAVASCASSLAVEAGWSRRRAAWFPLEVSTDARRKPVCASTPSGTRQIEILGTLAGSAPVGERGWRVRFETGVEATLVREPGGSWYSDESPEPSSQPDDAPKTPAGARRRRPEQSR
ncbi:MAG TPA: roadblock/LC7 domain-containing protein [Polyangiaceae bacterium]